MEHMWLLAGLALGVYFWLATKEPEE